MMPLADMSFEVTRNSLNCGMANFSSFPNRSPLINNVFRKKRKKAAKT